MKLAAYFSLAVVSLAISGLTDGTFYTDDCQFVFQETILWSEPSAMSEPVTSLPPGSTVDIIEYTESTYRLNGFTSEWFEVEWYNGTYISGYLPGAAFAFVEEPLNESEHLVITATGADSLTGQFTLTAIVLQNGARTAEESFLSGITEAGAGQFPSYSFILSERDPSGLAGITGCYLLSVAFFDEGYDSFDRIILWNGEKLEVLPCFRSRSGESNHEEQYSFVLPSDVDGIPGSIVVKRAPTESTDEEEMIIWSDCTG